MNGPKVMFLHDLLTASNWDDNEFFMEYIDFHLILFNFDFVYI